MFLGGMPPKDPLVATRSHVLTYSRTRLDQFNFASAGPAVAIYESLPTKSLKHWMNNNIKWSHQALEFQALTVHNTLSSKNLTMNVV